MSDLGESVIGGDWFWFGPLQRGEDTVPANARALDPYCDFTLLEALARLDATQ